MHINFNHIKTFYNALVHKMKSFRGNWEQNDPTAEDYIKNRPFYTDEPNEVLYVNNLTRYEYENYPTLPCNFVPGERYIVIWNGKRYDDVVCISDGSCNILGSYDGRYPFYIDDDGGDWLYISADGDFTVSIYIDKTVIHKIDSKYLPDGFGMPDDVVTDDELEDALNNRLATVAKSGSYDDLENRPTIYTDVIRYNTSQSLSEYEKSIARVNIGAASPDSIPTDFIRYKTTQDLSDNDKVIARYNIGAADDTKVVKLSPQTLTDLQKGWVRENIGAAPADASYTKEASDARYFVQSDWEQTDSSATDYIKNRTHGEEIHTEQTTKTISSTSEDKHIQIVTANLLKASYVRLQIGRNGFSLPIEDVVYGERIQLFSGTASAIGVGSAYQTIYYDEISGNYTVDIELVNVVGTNEVSLVVVYTLQKQLDEKYIPSTIARTNDFYTKEESDTRYAIAITDKGTIELRLAAIEEKLGL